jgi:thiamine pyrophosphate-dependent acetolactate synthase large subunit-like protein
MISVTFTADNLTALRKEIAEFLTPNGAVHTTTDPYPLGNAHVTVSQSVQAEAAAVVAALEPEVTETAPLAPAPTVEEQAPIPVETQTEQPTDSASDASLPSNDIDPDLVRQTTLRLASLKGRDAVMEVLKPYYVARSSEVPRDQWPKLIAELEAAQNG